MTGKEKWRGEKEKEGREAGGGGVEEEAEEEEEKWNVQGGKGRTLEISRWYPDLFLLFLNSVLGEPVSYFCVELQL